MLSRPGVPNIPKTLEHGSLGAERLRKLQAWIVGEDGRRQTDRTSVKGEARFSPR